LAVDTIKIANGAVTVSAYDDANLASGSIVTSGVAWTPIPGSTVVVSGIPASNARVVLDAATVARCRQSALQTFYLGIRRDTDSLVYQGPLISLPGNQTWIVTNWSFLDDTPLAGTQNYSLVIRSLTASENIGQWRDVRIVATVLKK
jgi:hypothetical protein